MTHAPDPLFKLVFGTVLLALGVMLITAGCNGPSYPAPLNQAITAAVHSRDYFPIAHGESENPSGDCNVCHGGLPTFEAFTCLMCHAHEKEATDATHRGLTDYSYDSQSCYSCHPRGESGGISRGEHSQRYFPIDVGSNHEDPSCAECHTTGEYTAFACIECHEHAQAPMASAHQGITGYAWESPACFSCHPTGESALSRDDHTQLYFPISAGTPHQDPSCAECHTTGDYGAFACIECHEHAQSPMASVHQGITGYAWESQACFGCHPNGESAGIGRDDHTQLYFPINAGTPHQDPGCTECHTTGDYEDFSCIECHEHAQSPMATEHAGVAGYTWQSEACLDCHPSGVAFSAADHDDFPIQPGAKHAEVSCSDCHTTSNYSQFACVDCHTHNASAMNSAHDDVADYRYASPSCYSCHPDSVVLTKAEHTPWFPITSGDHSRYGCTDCHKTQGTYQDFTCIGCHAGEHTCQKMNAEHQGEVRGYTCEDSACLSCHPDGREHDD